MARGGKREGAGRKPGEQTKAQAMIEEILETLDCRPIEILASFAKGQPTEKGGEKPTMEQRLGAAKELAQYIYPKRKAVENSIDPKSQLIIQKMFLGK